MVFPSFASVGAAAPMTESAVITQLAKAGVKRMIAALVERMREAQFERFRTTVMHDNADGRIAKDNCMTALRKLDNGPQSRP